MGTFSDLCDILHFFFGMAVLGFVAVSCGYLHVCHCTFLNALSALGLRTSKAELAFVVLVVSTQKEWKKWGCAWLCVLMEIPSFSFLIRSVRESIRF